jgi:hypothetical protein
VALCKSATRGSIRSSGLTLQKLNQIPTLLSLGNAKLHVIAGNEEIGVGEPSIDRVFLPGDMRLFDGRGVLELRHSA